MIVMINDGLSQSTPDLHHFCPTASVETIHQRFIERGDKTGRWTFHQTALCIAAHQDPILSAADRHR